MLNYLFLFSNYEMVSTIFLNIFSFNTIGISLYKLVNLDIFASEMHLFLLTSVKIRLISSLLLLFDN